MSVPILTTKLFIPPLRTNYVSRLTLVKKLNEGLQTGSRVTLISAPAGYGKTTLISEWAALCKQPIAWLSLDESDSSQSVFLVYFINALQNINKGIGETILAALQSSQPHQMDALIINLLNEIAVLPHNFILVLDDYHLVDSVDVDKTLAFIVDHQPPQMHLVIASREDPPLALARLRTRGQLTELRADQLRFTPSETADFLNRVMALKLAADEISTLESHIEGWAAGLQLAALCLQGRKEATPFIHSFSASRRFVLDYLLEEVLHQQSEGLQNFLLRTSILNRLCGSLCNAVLKDSSSDGQRTLEGLEQANLFIIPLDPERGWFRYHNLFRELLQKRLSQTLTPDEIKSAHLAASRWYQEDGDLAEAFQHALVAGDLNRSAELAEMAYREMDDKFQSARWLGWVKKIPQKTMSMHPLLCTQIGMALSDAGELHESETYLRYADRFIEQNGANDPFRDLPAKIALARAINAQLSGDLPATLKYAELTLQLTPEDDLLQRAQANIILGFTHWYDGDLEPALAAMKSWMASMHKIGNAGFVVASAFALADMLMALGRLREAKTCLEQSLDIASTQGEEVIKTTAHHYLGLALIALEWDDREMFDQHMQKARDLGSLTTLVDWPYRWNLAQALIKETEGDYIQALNFLEEAKNAYVINPIPDMHPVEALKARIHLKQGRLEKAKQWVQLQGLTATDEIRYLGEFEHLVFALVSIADGAFSGIDEMLTMLLQAAEAQNRIGSVIEILVTQSLFHLAQDDSTQAMLSLERALSLAEPEGYIRLFLNEGAQLRPLIERLAQDNAHPLTTYIHKLLSASSSHDDNNSRSSASAKTGLIDPLTSRELEVLRLVSQGLSNEDISKKLFISLSTVKGHNLRIFNKLQVQNRTEAVACARDLGLL